MNGLELFLCQCTRWLVSVKFVSLNMVGWNCSSLGGHDVG